MAHAQTTELQEAQTKLSKNHKKNFWPQAEQVEITGWCTSTRCTRIILSLTLSAEAGDLKDSRNLCELQATNFDIRCENTTASAS